MAWDFWQPSVLVLDSWERWKGVDLPLVNQWARRNSCSWSFGQICMSLWREKGGDNGISNSRYFLKLQWVGIWWLDLPLKYYVERLSLIVGAESWTAESWRVGSVDVWILEEGLHVWSLTGSPRHSHLQIWTWESSTGFIDKRHLL